MLAVLLIFANKVLFTIPAAIFAVITVPYRGFFPYREDLPRLAQDLPDYIYSLANFDGIHYIKIALLGYSEYEQAFFPLYPLLIRFAHYFIGNYLLVGLLLSNLSLLVGLIFFYKLLLLLLKNRATSLWIIAFIVAFPTAFYFHSVYTESVYFMLTSISLYHLKKGLLSWSVFFAILSSLTRFIGIFLFFPFFFTRVLRPRINLFKTFLYALLPSVGLLLYMVYLYKTTGNPLNFFTSLSAYGVGRSTNLVLLPQVYFRYLKIFFTADFSFAYMISVLEVLVFTFFFIVSLIEAVKAYKSKNYFYMGIALYSLVVVLLPTMTGSFTSIPRYALLAPAPFFFLARIKSAIFKASILIGFIVLQAILFAYFLQGYFIA